MVELVLQLKRELLAGGGGVRTGNVPATLVEGSRWEHAETGG